MAVLVSPSHIIFNLIQDGTVSLSFCLSVSCQLQHHTTWQWWPVCVIFNIIQDGSVGLSCSAPHKMAVWAPLCHLHYGSVGLCHLQHHTRWRFWPVMLNTIQDGSVGPSVSSSLWQCWSVSSSTSYKMAVLACHVKHHKRWQCGPLCVIFIIAVLVCVIFNITQDCSVGLCHLQHHTRWQCWSVSSSTSYKMAVWGYLCYVIFNITQDGSGNLPTVLNCTGFKTLSLNPHPRYHNFMITDQVRQHERCLVQKLTFVVG